MGKAVVVKMPDIGEGVVEGEIVEWLKNVGDSLRQDEPVVVVMTDKATVELPAPRPGKLARHHFKPGQIAMKDQPLYEIETFDDANEDEPVQQAVESVFVVKKNDPCLVVTSAVVKAENCRKNLATPPVRHLAKLLGVDLRCISGTGKDGRITVEDLRIKSTIPAASVESNIATIVEGDKEMPLLGVRRLMAEKMRISKEHIPHFSYFENVEASRLVRLREKMKQKGLEEDLHVTFMPFFIRALSLCIMKYPEINSSLDEFANKLVIHSHQHIGVAVASPQGLVVAVVRDAQEMTLNALIRAYDDLKKRAVTGKLLPSETKGSTITISNFGVFGGNGLWATPIINYPEAAIIAIDRIQKQPIVKNNEIAICEVLNVSWSFDHRFIDGEVAAKVSREFCSHILNPASLL